MFDCQSNVTLVIDYCLSFMYLDGNVDFVSSMENFLAITPNSELLYGVLNHGTY